MFFPLSLAQAFTVCGTGSEKRGPSSFSRLQPPSGGGTSQAGASRPTKSPPDKGLNQKANLCQGSPVPQWRKRLGTEKGNRVYIPLAYCHGLWVPPEYHDRLRLEWLAALEWLSLPRRYRGLLAPGYCC